MWEYCPMCCTTDEPMVIPVLEVNVILEGEDDKEVDSKQRYRCICDRCGYEREY
jgi:hypothetical protein